MSHLVKSLFMCLCLNISMTACASVPQSDKPISTVQQALLDELRGKPEVVTTTPTAVIAPPLARIETSIEKTKSDNKSLGPIPSNSRAHIKTRKLPKAKPFVSRVQTLNYIQGNIYHLYAAPNRITDLALEPGEALISVSAGDTAHWVIGDTKSGSGGDQQVHLMVKPQMQGLKTNLVILTDRRTYHLELESLAHNYMTSLAFTYPRAVNMAQVSKPIAEPSGYDLKPDQVHFTYELSGDVPSWKPDIVFDDGRRTFIAFPKSLHTGQVPPLFLIGTNGKAELVNYRQWGRFYIVDQIFDRAELRLGQAPQSVVRIRRLAISRPATSRSSPSVLNNPAQTSKNQGHRHD